MSTTSRSILAFALAPAIVALPLSVYLQPEYFLNSLIPLAIVMYGHALILGVPIYIALKIQFKFKIGMTSVLVCATAIGAIPVSLLSALGPAADYIRQNNQVLVDHHKYTTAGLLAQLESIVFCAGIGLAVGLVWALIAGRLANRWSHATPVGASEPDTRWQQRHCRSFIRFRS